MITVDWPLVLANLIHCYDFIVEYKEWFIGLAVWICWMIRYRWSKKLVERVIDGDTVRLKGDKINTRLHGIDAPERTQKFGSEATEYLKKLILNKYVKVDVITHDTRNNRHVSKLFRWGDIQKKIVKKALANADAEYSKDYVKYQQETKFGSPKEFRNKGK